MPAERAATHVFWSERKWKVLQATWPKNAGEHGNFRGWEYGHEESTRHTNFND